MDPRLTAVMLALVLATAGCNDVVFWDDGRTPSPSPKPVSTETASVTPSTPVSPPGIAADGVSSPLELTSAHTETLADVSYTMQYRRVLWADNGTKLGTYVREARVSPGWQRFRYRRVQTGFYADERQESLLLAYANFSHGFVVREIEGQRKYQYLYRTRTPISADYLSGKSVLYLVFDGVDTRVVDIVRRDGSEYYVLESTAGPHDYRDATVTNVTLSATVKRSGRVSRLRLEYDRPGVGDGNSGGGHVVEVLRFGGFNGTTVVEPAWVDQIRANRSSPPDTRD